MLLDGRSGFFIGYFFNVGGDNDRFDFGQVGDISGFAPVEELGNSTIVSLPCFFVSDGVREEL